MAGQPVSLAASAPADDERFPRFREVRDQALVAELQPGDAIYVPKLLVASGRGDRCVQRSRELLVGCIQRRDAMRLPSRCCSSLIAIAERPPAERQAWKAFFDHFVFRTHGHPLAHLPADQHGVLGPLKPDNYQKIRARVMQMLRVCE